jgi:phosphate transport system substrate-binding protein
MKRTIARRAVLSAGTCALFGGAAPPPADITGAGSTFVEPVLTKWLADYGGAVLHGGRPKIVYQGGGSGAGIDLIKARKVDFGASDKPLTPEELAKDGLTQFPIVIGGVVPVVNVSGVAPGQMRFSGPVLADIYLGRITRWDDPAITKLNRSLKLPNAPIVTVHRSDASGTTFNWVNYLSKVSPEWRAKVGEGTTVKWPTGDGEPGNDGVAAKISRTPNAIGYVEFAFVARHQLTWASMLNRAGRFVDPGVFSFQAAAKGASFRPDRDFYALLTDTNGMDAYPIAATTFVLLPQRGNDPAKTRAILQFFAWALENGRESATHLGYVPLPHPLVADVQAYWAKKFAYTGS